MINWEVIEYDEQDSKLARALIIDLAALISGQPIRQPEVDAELSDINPPGGRSEN